MRNSPETDTIPRGKKLDRRGLLKLASVAAYGLLVPDGQSRFDTVSLPAVDTWSKIGTLALELQPPRRLERIDTTYLRTLLAQLEHSTAAPREKVAATRGALRGIVNLHKRTPSDNGFMGTALQIDTSGIYLTANHAALYSRSPVLPQYELGIGDPYSGRLNPVRGVIKHHSADIALLYAPTGNEPGPTPHIRITSRQPVGGEPLWMLSLWGQGLDWHTASKRGLADTALRFASAKGHERYFPEIVYEPKARVAVAGLQPYGGASGSPIIDTQGSIIGIESGAYPGTGTKPSEYHGAIVTPLSSYTLGNMEDQLALLY